MPAEFRVLVEVGVAADDDVADDVVDALAPLAGVVQLGARRWAARFTVQSPDARSACLRGWSAWQETCRRTGAPGRPVVRLEVVATDADDRAAAVAPLPDLVGVAEVAAILGVTRQRASQLARDRRFPRAVAHLASGPVWDAAAVRAFAARRG